MIHSKRKLAKELLFGALIPSYEEDGELENAVAIIATPFNCYLEGQEPDASNAVIADIVMRYIDKFDVPFIGQREQADILRAYGYPVMAQLPTRDGERVESQRLASFQAQHASKMGSNVIRIGMPEHLGRCVALDRYFGLTPRVPFLCRTVPYDPAVRPGFQKWCTSRQTFVQYERFIARPGTVAKLALGLVPST